MLRSSEPERGSAPKVVTVAARWRCFEVCVESMTACNDWRKAALCSRGLTCASWCDQEGATDALGGEDESSLSVWLMREEMGMRGRCAGSPLGDSWCMAGVPKKRVEADEEGGGVGDGYAMEAAGEESREGGEAWADMGENPKFSREAQSDMGDGG